MLDGNDTPGSSVSRVWIILAVVGAVLVLGDLNRRMADARRLERDALQLQTEVASLETDREILLTQAAGSASDALVEAWAREQARMVRSGEHLIVPLAEPGTAPEPTPQARDVADPPSPWEVWRALLFGEP